MLPPPCAPEAKSCSHCAYDTYVRPSTVEPTSVGCILLSRGLCCMVCPCCDQIQTLFRAIDKDNSRVITNDEILMLLCVRVLCGRHHTPAPSAGRRDSPPQPPPPGWLLRSTAVMVRSRWTLVHRQVPGPRGEEDHGPGTAQSGGGAGDGAAAADSCRGEI